MPTHRMTGRHCKCSPVDGTSGALDHSPIHPQQHVVSRLHE
jgi:hypothetical protein